MSSHNLAGVAWCLFCQTSETALFYRPQVDHHLHTLSQRANDTITTIQRLCVSVAAYQDGHATVAQEVVHHAPALGALHTELAAAELALLQRAEDVCNEAMTHRLVENTSPAPPCAAHHHAATTSTPLRGARRPLASPPTPHASVAAARMPRLCPPSLPDNLSDVCRAGAVGGVVLPNKLHSAPLPNMSHVPIVTASLLQQSQPPVYALPTSPTGRHQIYTLASSVPHQVIGQLGNTGHVTLLQTAVSATPQVSLALGVPPNNVAAMQSSQRVHVVRAGSNDVPIGVVQTATQGATQGMVLTTHATAAATPAATQAMASTCPMTSTNKKRPCYEGETATTQQPAAAAGGGVTMVNNKAGGGIMADNKQQPDAADIHTSKNTDKHTNKMLQNTTHAPTTKRIKLQHPVTATSSTSDTTPTAMGGGGAAEGVTSPGPGVNAGVPVNATA